MSTTVYGVEYHFPVTATSGTCKIRSMCVYDVTSSNTQTTISGTIYLQHSGSKYNSSSSVSYKYSARVGLYLGTSAPSKAVSSNYYVGACSTDTVTITDYYDVTSASNHSSWTSVKSKAFSISIPKTTSAQTKYFMYGMGSMLQGTSLVSYGGYKTISVPAKTSYAVTYNANGGSGAPASQTKYYGETLTLSSAKPTRTNYVFKNWNTASGGTGTTYNPGASYTANAALTLYAQWYAPYTVTYNANGGTGGPTTQTKVYNTNLTLTTSQPTRSGYAFVKWNTKSDGTGTSYNSGATYSSNANVTLYAIWAAVPSIGNLTAVRCDENGDQDDEGAYATVTCTWSCSGSSTITGTITPQSGGSATSFTFGTSPSGSGTVTSIALVGSGNGMELDTDMQYTVSVTVTCTTGGTTKTATRNVILTRAFFVMDWKAGGDGVGIGRAAPSNGLEVGYPAVFDSTLSSYGTIYGKFGEIYSDLRGTGITEYPRVATISGNAKLSTNSGNDVSSAQTVGGFIIRGKDNNYTSMFDSYMFPASHADHPGGVSSRLITRNMKTDGSYATNTFAVYTHKDGSAHYSCTNPANFRSDLGIVSKIGDTMTGVLSIKSSNINRDTSNPSADQWGSNVSYKDADGERIASVSVARRSDGKMSVGLYVYNEKSDGTEVNNGFVVNVDKNGNQSYSGSGPAMRSAFDLAQNSILGQFLSGAFGSSSDVSMANDTSVNLGTYTISTAGTYIIIGCFRFASNATGFRQGIIGTASAENAAPIDRSVMVQAANGWQTIFEVVYPVVVSSSTKFYFVGKQKSGGALTGNVYWRIWRLK